MKRIRVHDEMGAVARVVIYDKDGRVVEEWRRDSKSR